MEVTIRKASFQDHNDIALFQEKMALETEHIRLDPSVVKEGVKAVIADFAKGCYYVAENDGEIVGCLLTTFEWSDWRNGKIIWIQSLYVLPEFRNKGIFKQLYDHVKQLVENDPNLKAIRLYVDKTNMTAINVYRKCGMNGEHYQLFEWQKGT